MRFTTIPLKTTTTTTTTTMMMMMTTLTQEWRIQQRLVDTGWASADRRPGPASRHSANLPGQCADGPVISKVGAAAAAAAERRRLQRQEWMIDEKRAPTDRRQLGTVNSANTRPVRYSGKYILSSRGIEMCRLTINHHHHHHHHHHRLICSNQQNNAIQTRTEWTGVTRLNK